MRRTYALVGLVIPLVEAPRAQDVAPEVSYVQLEQGEVRDVVARDVDGDGRIDLVIGTGPMDGARWLHVHLGQDASPQFRARPDRRLRLVRDAVAFAVADVDPTPGHEIVLLSSTRAATVLWRDEGPSYASIGRLQLLWQPADPDRCFAWQSGVVDLDADGLDDLLIPEPGGYRLLVQRRGTGGSKPEFATTRLELPPRVGEEQTRSGVRISRSATDFDLSFVGTESGPLLEVRDTVPAAHVADWDGDGLPDLVALSRPEVLVWRQGSAGAFDAAPSIRIELGKQHGSNQQQWGAKAMLRDLDGDADAELLLVSTRGQGSEVLTSVEVFHDAETIASGKPADRLRLRGWSSRPELDDVDGDGLPDLAIGSLRVGALDALNGGGDSVEGQLNLFRNGFERDAGRFVRPVALAHRAQLPTDGLRDRGVTARFFPDANRDGLRDLVLASGKELRLLPMTRRGRGYRLGDVAWRLPLEDEAMLTLDDVSGLVLVREERQVIVLDWRPR